VNFVLKDTAHRPYPPPSKPWLMAQTWIDLLFMHWPVSIESLRSLIPSFLEIDIFDSQAWIGIVPFSMKNIHFHFLPPIPAFSALLELNVRSYVKYQGKSGVYFFSLDASHPVAVEIARTFFSLPYYNAKISSKTENDWYRYKSSRIDKRGAAAILEVDYQPIGDIYFSEGNSLEAWLTERYCFFSSNAKGQQIVGEIHHKQWPLQKANAIIHQNTMAQALGIALPDSAPLLHFIRHIDTVEWAIGSL